MTRQYFVLSSILISEYTHFPLLSTLRDGEHRFLDLAIRVGLKPADLAVNKENHSDTDRCHDDCEIVRDASENLNILPQRHDVVVATFCGIYCFVVSSEWSDLRAVN